MDRYANFENLVLNARRGIDYRIRLRRGGSGVAILSIHGGDIEPGTTCIADAIAGPDHTFYTFEGVKPAGNFALHITSANFDEPSAMEIICAAETVISIHGSAGAAPMVTLGGLDVQLRDRILQALRAAGFQAVIATGRRLRGIDRENICNLCGRGMGVQMEINRGLRALMFRDLTPAGRRFPTAVLDCFCRAVRAAIIPAAVSFDTDR